MEYRILVEVEGVEVERDMMVRMCVHGKGRLPCLIESVIAQSHVSLGVRGYHDAVGRVDLGRKFSGTLSALVWHNLASRFLVCCPLRLNAPWSHQCLSS